MARKKESTQPRLVAYYRYSGGSRQTEQSIEGQRRDCEAYARAHGMTILREYVDRHTSGKTDDRAQFRQMIDDSAKRTFDLVICWKTDRFARNRYDSAVYKKQLRDNGVSVIYAAESNIEGAEGIIIEGLMEALAEYYSAELAEKARRGMRESALKGQTLGRTPPLGLTVDSTKHYVIDPAGADTVRLIFELYASGLSIASIIRRLNGMGLRTVRGNPFDKSSISRIIRDERYRGVYVSKKFDVRIEGAIPPIIDDDLWERTQKMIKLNRQSRAPHSAKADYILSGKLYCGECGCLMKGICGHNPSGRVYHYYSCPSRSLGRPCTRKNMPKDVLEKLVVESTSNLLLRSENIQQLADAIVSLQQAEASRPDPERAALEQALAEIRRKIGNILSAIENGTASAALTSRLSDLEQQESALDHQLVSLSTPEPFTLSRDEVIFLLEQFRVSPSERTNAYCRRLVDTFVDKVELTNRELIIHFNISKSTENKNSQSNNGCSTGNRLVGDERIELPQVESESTALPLCKSPISCCVSRHRAGQRVLL